MADDVTDDVRDEASGTWSGTWSALVVEDDDARAFTRTHLDNTLRMLRAFTSQAHRDYMAEDVVLATARYWSRFTRGRYAELLETVRSTMHLTPAAERRVDGGAAGTGHA